MILFALGIITGILLAIVCLLTILVFGGKIIENPQTIKEKIKNPFKKEERISILEPISTDQEALQEIYEQNKARGQDTKL